MSDQETKTNGIVTDQPYDLTMAIAVMKDVCSVNDNNPGYIANTIRKLFKEEEFTLDDWKLLAEASGKTPKWAAQCWASNQ
jgi:hypothetical protein